MLDSSIWSIDQILSEWTWERWQWRVLRIPQSSALLEPHIRLFNIMSRILVVEGSYPSAEILSVYSTAPADYSMPNHDYMYLSNIYDL